MRSFARVARVSPDRSRADFSTNGGAGNQTMVDAQPGPHVEPATVGHVGMARHKLPSRPQLKPRRHRIGRRVGWFRPADDVGHAPTGNVFSDVDACSRRRARRVARLAGLRAPRRLLTIFDSFWRRSGKPELWPRRGLPLKQPFLPPLARYQCARATVRKRRL